MDRCVARIMAYVGTRSGENIAEMILQNLNIVWRRFMFHIFLRRRATGMPSLSRYLATVRRASS